MNGFRVVATIVCIIFVSSLVLNPFANTNWIMVHADTSAPTVSLSPTSWALDIGQFITFTATASGGSGTYTSYQWYVNGQLVANGWSVYSYVFMYLGTYSITVTVTDSSGATSASSSAATVTVNASPTVYITPGGPVTLDAGQPQTFTATASGGTGTLTYQWYLNGSPIGINSNTYYFSESTGSYSLTCDVRDSSPVPEGSTLESVASNAVSITVNQLTPTPTPTPTLTPTPVVTPTQSSSITGSPSPSPSPTPKGATGPQIILPVTMTSNSGSISSANIAEPYSIQVKVKNPDTVPHTYSLQLAQTIASIMNGGLETASLPGYLSNAMTILEVPTEWNANPTCWITEPPPQTVAPGATATFTFSVTSDWNWIPPWTWTYLFSSALLALATGAIPAVKALSNVYTAVQLATFSNVFSNYDWFISREQFDLQVLSGTTDLHDFSVTAYVPYNGVKFIDYVGTIVESALASTETFAGIGFVIIGVGGALVLAEALTIALQNLLYIAAADPSSDYTQVVQPVPLMLNNGTLFTDLPAFKILPDNQSELLQALANVISYQNATTQSIVRYNGAVEDNAQNYAKLQLQAIANYSAERDQYFSSFENQLSLLYPQLPSLNSTSIQTAMDYLQQNGLPPVEKQVLTGLGLSSSINDVTASLLLFNATTVGNFTLTDGVQAMNAALDEETNLWNQTAAASNVQSSPQVGQPNTPYVEIILIVTVTIAAGLSSAAIVSRIRKRRIEQGK